MQDNIFIHINSKIFINEIITCDRITIENNLNSKLNTSNIIYRVIKRCEQFFNKIWKNFQNFFILLKKDTNKTNSDILISFYNLSCYLYSHQLYKSFVMLIKREDSSGGEYLDN